MTFRGYFDDSGHPDDQGAVIVGGFIATEEQWISFEDDWNTALKSAGLESLHMTEFEKSNKWGLLKKGVLRRRFVQTIKRHTRFRITQTVLMDDYRRINEEYAFQEVQGAPYALIGRTVAKCINEWQEANMGESDRLQIFYEDGTKHKGELIDIMERDELPCPSFLKKREAVQLQAADMVAWEAFHAVQNQSVRKSLDSFTKQPGIDGIYRYSDLEEMCRVVPIPKRANVVVGTKFSYHSAPKKIRRRTIG